MINSPKSEIVPVRLTRLVANFYRKEAKKLGVPFSTLLRMRLVEGVLKKMGGVK